MMTTKDWAMVIALVLIVLVVGYGMWFAMISYAAKAFCG